jgi:hypothetical protein
MNLKNAESMLLPTRWVLIAGGLIGIFTCLRIALLLLFPLLDKPMLQYYGFHASPLTNTIGFGLILLALLQVGFTWTAFLDGFEQAADVGKRRRFQWKLLALQLSYICLPPVAAFLAWLVFIMKFRTS